jgi:hypothetical protein
MALPYVHVQIGKHAWPLQTTTITNYHYYYLDQTTHVKTKDERSGELQAFGINIIKQSVYMYSRDMRS